jgi:hypothetical protein
MATTTSKPSKVGSNFYTTSVTTNTDGSLKSTTSRTDAQGNNGVPVSSVNTTSTGQSTRTPESGATSAETAAFNNPNSPERQAYTQQVQSQNPYGPNPTASDQTKLNSASGKPNAATNNPTPPGQGGTQPTPEQSAEAAKEAGSTKEGTRTSYSNDMKYPRNLQSEVQDVIKFSILEYSPSLAKGNRSESAFGSGKNRVVTLEGNNPIIKGSTRIGMITLPIPAGISDSNPVGWQSGDLNMLQSAAAKAADTLLSGGTVGEAVTSGAGGVKPALDTGDASDAIRGIFVGMAAQGSGIMQRTQGAVLNNNTELLFSGPSLRNFSFTFLFYPREPDEAKMVRQIIRAFKQAMSVKRSATSLLLKSPHTFAIQYMTAGQKAHPYLNRFKECALTSCNVDYTPDGTYMTYDGDEKSMTAYRLSLSFQELEPLFDDEYGLDDDNVGF